MKYMHDLVSHFFSKPAFSVDELKAYFHRRQAPEGYHKVLIQNLLNSGKIFRIARGSYTFHEEIQYVGFAFKPFYYGLEDALSLRELWEQETNPVIITPRKVRNGLRQFEGRNYLIRWIDRKMFFGYSLIKYGEFYIPVSDIEKTLIDLFYFGVKIPSDTLEEILKLIDRERFVGYLEEVSPKLRIRMASLMERS